MTNKITATLYQRPNGTKKPGFIVVEDKALADWFIDNKIVVSVEPLDNNMAAIYGRKPGQEEEDELIVLTGAAKTADQFMMELKTAIEEHKS